MTEPAFDADGYPTDETLAAISAWPANHGRSLFGFIGEAWYWPKYYRIHWPWVHASTGGWSGNESLIGALQEHPLYGLWFFNERSGGHYTFKVRALRTRKEDTGIGGGE